ncbi:hypothetical protein NIES2107_31630 [Nostoc carneum NIES-2107]|nr:hypothetical protein NIES2107_31630 [Nostoc carneum NIES-2107]
MLIFGIRQWFLAKQLLYGFLPPPALILANVPVRFTYLKQSLLLGNLLKYKTLKLALKKSGLFYL